MSDLQGAFQQAWPPFVLVAGLMLLGQVAGREGVFELLAAHVDRVPGPPALLLLVCLGLVALVTAVLNLDTAVVFLTPVLLAVATRRGLAREPFLYGAVFMANASSLFLPGSNLTNLLVRDASGHGAGSGADFFAAMAPAALCACALTAAGLLVIHRHRLARADADTSLAPPQVARPGAAGVAGVVGGAVLMLLLADPALWVLGLGLVVLAASARAGRSQPVAILRALGLPSLLGLFVLAVALGWLARASSFPAAQLAGAGRVTTTAVAAGASVLVNNLPAAVLLSSRAHLPAHALLIGLDIGPNLAVSGSLAVLLWWRAARTAGAQPSVLAYSIQGIPLALVAITGALLAGGI